MAQSPLVPSIAPLVESLRQFTPQAQEERAFKLAGLQQQQDLGQAQLQSVQATNKRNQIIDAANSNRVELIKMRSEFAQDKIDLKSVLSSGVEGLRNNITKLIGTKEADDPDMEELVHFANLSVTDPDAAWAELQKNQIGVDNELAGIDLGISTVNRILNPVSAKDQSIIDLNKAKVADLENVDGISNLPAEAIAFRDLIKDFTPEQQKLAKLVKTGLKGRAMSNALLTAIGNGDVTKLAEARAEIKQAEKFAELTGASRGKAIDSGFESIVKIDAGIKNIDRAISALDKGAGVGAVEKIWPSIKSASVELDNIRGQMALDVVGATTFGALSKGELDLAKDIALPTGLNTEELKDFLTRKKVAQTKLKAYYNEQIQFLDQGGTVAGFLREKERQQGAPANQQNTAQPKFLGFE